MNSKPTNTNAYHIQKLENLTELKDQQIQRNQELIERSLEKIANIKIARLEMKYFVACTLDYLDKTIPQLSSTTSPDPTVIDFASAKARRLSSRLGPQLKKSSNSNYVLSSYPGPGSK